MNKSGDDVAEDTPVPIPNTEVKLSRGEGSEFRLVRIANCQAFFIRKLSLFRDFFLLSLYLKLTDKKKWNIIL